MDLRISSPCPKTWESLVGNDRIRYCGDCRLNVYNLAAMHRDEVAGIVRKTQGRLCGTLYVRSDRTATVRDCSKGSLRKKIRRAWAVAGALLLAVFAWCMKGIDAPDRSIHHPWVRSAIEWLDPEPQPPVPMVLGKICPPPPPPPPNATP